MLNFGSGSATYEAAGALAGITQLVEDFYEQMSTLPEARPIRTMHPQDLTLSKQKLTYFLSGWMGGPKLYAEHFGAIHIPGAHSHLAIGDAEAEQWLTCMAKALQQQPYSTELKDYLNQQFKFPANAIKLACGH